MWFSGCNAIQSCVYYCQVGDNMFLQNTSNHIQDNIRDIKNLMAHNPQIVTNTISALTDMNFAGYFAVKPLQK